MENNTVSKHTISFGLALAISSVINALLVIAKEKSTALQGEMRRLTGSHWMTHVAVVLILFVTVGFLCASIKGGLWNHNAGQPLHPNDCREESSRPASSL